MFCIAAFFEAYSELFNWNIPVYKTYYVLALANVMILGSGTVYLLHEKKALGSVLVPRLFLGFSIVITLVLAAVATLGRSFLNIFIC